MTRRRTSELRKGDSVATTKVMTSQANGVTYVRASAPGVRGTVRVVEDIAAQPVDSRSENDRLVYFADGAIAATKLGHWWTVKSKEEG